MAKTRLWTTILFVFISLFFLIFPKISLAELRLSKQEVNLLLNAIQQALIDEWLYLTSSPDFREPEKQAALFIIRNAIQKQELDYFFKEIPLKILKSAIQIAGFLLTHRETEKILEKLEKQSIEKAVEMGIDWLLQNEVKIAKGHFNYSWTSYRGNIQKPSLYYLVVYRAGEVTGEVTIEIYSSEWVEPSKPTASTLWLGRSSWNFSSWRAAGKTRLEPFIIRIKGEVKELPTGGYIWHKTDFINVTFSEPVPDLSRERERFKIPLVSEWLQEWEERFEKIKILTEKFLKNFQSAQKKRGNFSLEFRRKTEQIFKSFKSNFLRLFSFRGGSVTEFSSHSREELSTTQTQERPELGQTGKETEDILSTLEEIVFGVPSKAQFKDEQSLKAREIKSDQEILSLEEIQEQLDDLAENIDILNQEVVKIIQAPKMKKTTQLEKKREKSEVTSEITTSVSEKTLQEAESFQELLEKEEQEEKNIKIAKMREEKILGRKSSKKEEFNQPPRTLKEKRVFTGGSSLELCQKKPGVLAGQNKIIINEIAWMGTEKSSHDEWIELKNISAKEIDLVGWQLLDKDKQIRIVFPRIILSPGRFLLLERTDDTSVATIPADLIYTGSLRNEDEALYLFDKNCHLEDEVLASPNWPAGDNSSKRTMERKTTLGWQTSEERGGTPKKENSQGYEKVVNSEARKNGEKEIESQEVSEKEKEATGGKLEEKEKEEMKGEQEREEESEKRENQGQKEIEQQGREEEISKEETPLLTVIINEIGWMGTAASPHDEWIELYNNTEEEIDLTGWLLKAEDGTPEISLSGTISAKSFYLLERSDDISISDIPADLIFRGAFGNQGEKLELRDSQGNLIDLVDCQNGWFAGKASPEYVSMERINSQADGSDPQNWQDNNKIIINGFDKEGDSIFGTPKAKNSPNQGPIILPKFIRHNLTLTKEFSPYFIDNPVIIEKEANFKIDPGVVMKFFPQNNAYFDIYGSFQVQGTPQEPIIFTSLRDSTVGGETLRNPEDFASDGKPFLPRPGDWRHLYFRRESSGFIKNAVFRYGGTRDSRNAVIIAEDGELLLENVLFTQNTSILWLKNSSAQIKNVELKENIGFPYSVVAVRIEGGSPLIQNSLFKGNRQNYLISIHGHATPQIKNNLFEDNEGLPLYVGKGSTPFLIGNQGRNNEINGILISQSGGSFPEDAVFYWEFNENFPYVIPGFFKFPVNVTLNIKPGVIIKIGDYLRIEGKLIAQGSENNPIIFTSFSDDEYGGDTNNDGRQSLPQPGEWRNIQIMRSAQATFQNVQIRYAGKDSVEPLFIENGAQVEEENLTYFP